ncbi:hypothetical protein IHE45_19G132000 [Dioscorea alata]|uniref:Uncharacterized protein n=1 Tax=Dioscorea alata TaxID=55571 RepID=A0ACB7U1U5_DIOAL|nr:hypothetical protein IHE45_19G132000 [Dioscorea alata]
MDWRRCMNELPPAISEESADSEANSGWPFAGTDIVIDDEDDAESCSGVTDHGMGEDQRILSWKSWLMEISPKYEQCNNINCDQDGHKGKDKGEGEVEGEDDGMSTMEELVDEKESNRLFWEACLAHGYP